MRGIMEKLLWLIVKGIGGDYSFNTNMAYPIQKPSLLTENLAQISQILPLSHEIKFNI